MRRALTAAVLAALFASARAADEAPYPLRVEVGKTVAICPTNTIQCPAGAGRCDDASVAAPTVTAEGLSFEGVAPGTTLCSAGSVSGWGPRRVYEVTVVKPVPPDGKDGKDGKERSRG
ncbi:MAG: hypothetical protein HZB56_07050 [Deltaproteobacteria bacterium]|nr:hypothetical protein [Deltaproteobacteria bacterium]